MSTKTDITLADLDLFADGAPWAVFADLRKNSPVHWNVEDSPNHGFWSVTRYRDIVDVLRDTQTFSSEIGAVSLEELDERQMEIRRSMIETDGERHRALRKLLQPQFTPRALAGYETFLRGITATTLDRALVKDQFDFVADVAADFPSRVLAQLLDVPESDIPKLIKWGNRMIGNTDPEHADVLANSEESDQYKDLPFRSPAALEVFNYGFELAEQRRGGSGTDLVSTLINQVPSDGIELDDRDFRNYFLLLVIAGNETTRHTITHTMNNLMANPDQIEILRERPELIPWAVEEFLRMASPVHHFRRTARQAVIFNGQEIKAGDKVVVWFGSGNRDEEVFKDPNVLDVQRLPNEQMSFGRGGPHMCLGNSLARLEIQIMFEDLLARGVDLLPNGKPDYVRSNFVHGFKRLPVQKA
ncbi:MAG: cytochrome P450 [Candidatus Nanopelagicales bacterium]|nr:cytochrome P450 [Candidatus Nanopelagicales bacterium]PHX60741.1 MAG: cytochrome P450 [Actinomycetota bacterium]